MIEGELEHQDRTGNQAVVRVGKVQRTIAGTGIVHSQKHSNQTKIFHFKYLQPEISGV